MSHIEIHFMHYKFNHYRIKSSIHKLIDTKGKDTKRDRKVILKYLIRIAYLKQNASDIEASLIFCTLRITA